MTTPQRGFQCHAINNQINIQIKHDWVKNPNWPVGYLQAWPRI